MSLLDRILGKTFSHGVHPPQEKDQTAAKAIKRLPFPPEVIVPLSQHIGAPAKAIVTKGQEVVRGEPIAVANGYMSVPMHAPVTGTVTGIELVPSARGPKTEAIIIKTYTASNQRVLYGNDAYIDEMDSEQIIEAVQNTGMVGLGGAGFPSHAKLKLPDKADVDTMVVNGGECEPYLTTDHRLRLEKPEQLIRGINIALKATGAKHAIIGIEDNKMDAVELLRSKITESDPIEVGVVKTKYPQGSEKRLITT